MSNEKNEDNPLNKDFYKTNSFTVNSSIAFKPKVSSGDKSPEISSEEQEKKNAYFKANAFAFNSLGTVDDRVLQEFKENYESALYDDYFRYSRITFKILYVLMVGFLWAVDADKINEFKDLDYSWVEIICYPFLFWVVYKLLFDWLSPDNIYDKGEYLKKTKNLMNAVILLVLAVIGYFIFSPLFFGFFVCVLFAVFFDAMMVGVVAKKAYEANLKMFKYIEEKEPNLHLSFSSFMKLTNNCVFKKGVDIGLKENYRSSVVQIFNSYFKEFKLDLRGCALSIKDRLQELNSPSVQVFIEANKKYNQDIESHPDQRVISFLAELLLKAENMALVEISKDLQSLNLGLSYYCDSLIFLNPKNTKVLGKEELEVINKRLCVIGVFNQIRALNFLKNKEKDNLIEDLHKKELIDLKAYLDSIGVK